MLSQPSLIAALAAEIDRQLPGAILDHNATVALIEAANIVCAAQHGMTIPEPEPGDEAELVALDRIPGWEAA